MKKTRVFIEAYACDDNGDGPRFATVEVDDVFLSRLLTLRVLCGQHKLTEVRVEAGPDRWGPGDDVADLRLESDELVVSQNSFWFVAQPKHSQYHVETRMQDIAAFYDAVRAGQTRFAEWEDEDWDDLLDVEEGADAGVAS